MCADVRYSHFIEGDLPMEKEHGFTQREEWRDYFQAYFDRIRSIEKLPSFSLYSSENKEQWLSMYKERSVRLRAMYLENEEYFERHIYWFAKHNDCWEEAVAAPLLDNLFRNCMRMEDIEIAQKSAESLYRYYEAAGNEVAMMKCMLIFLTNMIMLDFPHNKRQILDLSSQAIDIYERHYNELNEEEKSLGLSLYDCESNACGEYAAFEPFISTDEIIARYHQRMSRIDTFISEENMELDVNLIVPYLRVCWQSSFASMPIKYPAMELTPIQIKEFLAVSEQMAAEENEDSGIARHVKICILKLMLRQRLHDVSDDQVMCELLKLQEMLPDPTLVYDNELIDTFQLLCCSMNNMTLTDKRYEEAVKGILQILLKAYMTLPSNNYVEHVMDNTIFIYTFPLLNYLPYEQVVKSTLFLTIFRQPQTAVHTVMVSKMAVAIIKEMIHQIPEAFLGLGCFSNVSRVKAREKELIDYIEIGAMLHDIGKILSSNVINMQYRKLIDLEFEAIKLHPVTSGEILKQVSVISNYYDIAVGHHKSFDGKRGYPESFDNTASKQKVFIDLITICDTLDAATDNLGRNYTKNKQLVEVLKELEAEKGTRYSDVIVNVLLNSPTLQQELQNILNLREEIYIHVFELIQKETDFFPEDEETEVLC